MVFSATSHDANAPNHWFFTSVNGFLSASSDRLNNFADLSVIAAGVFATVAIVSGYALPLIGFETVCGISLASLSQYSFSAIWFSGKLIIASCGVAAVIREYVVPFFGSCSAFVGRVI